MNNKIRSRHIGSDPESAGSSRTGTAAPSQNQPAPVRLVFLFTGLVFIIIMITVTFCALFAFLLVNLGYIPEPSRRPYTMVTIFVLSCGALGSIIAVFISRRPLQPLQEMMNATDKIAGGDFQVRVRTDYRGYLSNFNPLCLKFNHMAEELGSVEMLRSDFINDFSHEFRTPIVSIRGFAKALKWDDLTDVEREEYLDIIIEESERLSSLSESVLNLSRVEKQNILTDTETFDVSEQIRRVAAMLLQKWDEKNISLSVSEEDVLLPGNRKLLEQVWVNLLDNAFKFSEAGGEIDVRVLPSAREEGRENGKNRNAVPANYGRAAAAREEGRENSKKKNAAPAGYVRVIIQDHGKGMTPEECSHIFEKFYQADPSHASMGSGLGLPLAARIVQLHGGTIKVESAVGAGSTFTVSLPAA